MISFEPIPSIYNDLRKNCSLNNIMSKCELHNFAISNEHGEKKIQFNKNHSGSTSLIERHKNKNSSLVTIKMINKTILNNLIKDKNKNYVIKIDVEGFELTVLQELFKCNFAPSISNIFYEVDNRWGDESLIKKLLLQNGFRNFKKIGKGHHYDVMAIK